MKRFFSILVSLVLFSGVLVDTGAQSPYRTWQSTEWGKNISELLPFESSGNTYLLHLHSDKKNAYMNKLNSDGTAGEQVWSVDSWLVGLDAAERYVARGKAFFLIGKSENSSTWIFQTRDNNYYPTNNTATFGLMEPGITDFIAYEESGRSYIVALQPVSGKLYIAQLKADGSVPGLTTDIDTDKGHVAGDVLQSGGKTYLLLANPSYGKTLIYEIDAGGKLGKGKIGPDFPGIERIAAIESNGQHYAVSYAPSAGELWVHKLNEDASFGEQTFHSTTWEKGCTNMADFEINGTDYVVFGNPSTGSTSIYTGFVPGGGTKVTGDNSNLVTSLDNFDQSINNLKGTLSEMREKLMESFSTVHRISTSKEKTSSLKDRIMNISEVLGTFETIPKLGRLCGALATGLEKSTLMLDPMIVSLAGVEKTSVDPTRDQLNTARLSIKDLTDNITKYDMLLKEIKKNESMLSDPAKAQSLHSSLTVVHAEFQKVNNEIVKINNSNNFITAVREPLKIFNKLMIKFDNAVGKADDIANKVDDVLDKRFKKKVLGKTISVSLKDVLTGGGLADKVKKFTKKWVGKLIDPLLKKLLMKLPKLPGVEMIKKAMTTVKDNTVGMEKAAAKLDASGKVISQQTTQLAAAFNIDIDQMWQKKEKTKKNLKKLF